MTEIEHVMLHARVLLQISKGTEMGHKNPP